MAEITYTGVIEANGTLWLNTDPASMPTITGTVGVASSTSAITLTLQNNMNNTVTTGVVQAVLTLPVSTEEYQLAPVVTYITNTDHAPLTTTLQTITIHHMSESAASSITPTTSNTLTRPASVSSGSGSSFTSTNSASTSAKTSTGVTSTPAPKTPEEFSTGELAGAAVGCLLAGFLIAGLLAFCFFRRRAGSRKRARNLATGSMREGAHGKAIALEAGPAKLWDKRLPQPDSDKSIAQLASRTLDEVELFVEEFYVNKSTTMLGPVSTSELANFDSPYVQQPLADLMSRTRNPIVLIKHSIALCMLRKIDPSCNDEQSLLPREYIVPRSGTGSRQESRQMISQLRVLMAYAHPDLAQDDQYVRRRDRATEEFIGRVEAAFQPWERGDTSKRKAMLKGIMVHVSELGIKLFSQPALFQWQWDERTARGESNAVSRNRDGIVMLPGLEKVTDQQAERLAVPICLVKPRWGSLSR